MPPPPEPGPPAPRLDPRPSPPPLGAAPRDPLGSAGEAGTELRTLHLVVFLSVATACVTYYMNRVVLTDQVYAVLLGDAPGGALQLEERIRLLRRWETLGVLSAPLLVLVRSTVQALLVQLAFLLQGVHARLATCFRGAIWAGWATWLGHAMQAAWLSTLPPGSITPERLGDAPGSLTTLFPALATSPSPLALLWQQLSVFDLGWILLFAVAIEHRTGAGPVRALASVGSVWVATVLARWTLLVYLSGV